MLRQARSPVTTSQRRPWLRLALLAHHILLARPLKWGRSLDLLMCQKYGLAGSLFPAESGRADKLYCSLDLDTPAGTYLQAEELRVRWGRQSKVFFSST